MVRTKFWCVLAQITEKKEKGVLAQITRNNFFYERTRTKNRCGLALSGTETPCTKIQLSTLSYCIHTTTISQALHIGSLMRPPFATDVGSVVHIEKPQSCTPGCYTSNTNFSLISVIMACIDHINL